MTILSDGDFVVWAQRALKDRGFDVGVPDGIAGKRTQDAFLKAIGAASGLAPIPAPVDPGGVKLPAASEAKLKGIHPDLIKVVRRAAEITAVPFVVLEGLRTIERQRALVAQGSSKTLRSRHLTGHAVDVAPLVNGKVSFDWADFDRMLPAFRQGAKDVGVDIELGADWVSFKDGPHVQLPWATYP